MEYNKHKDIHLEISRIGFGGASLSGEGKGYGFGKMSEKQAQALLERSFASGINIYDAAPIYGHNLCEKRLGKYLKNIREKVLLVSKSGVSWHDNGRVNMTNDISTTKSMLESSLRNFNSDYIDIYMIHWPDVRVDIRYPLEILQKAKEAGKIKYIGLCNTHNEDLERAESVCNIQFLQSEVNLFNNGFLNLEADLIQSKIKMGWGTFDKGILSGHLKTNHVFDSTDCRSWAPWWKKSNWKDKVKKVESYIDKFVDKNEALGIKELALSYSLRNADITLCGMKKSDHLKNIEQIMGLKNLNSFDDSLEKFKVQ